MKQVYTLLLILISVLASGQKQVTDFKMIEKPEDRFSSLVGEADGRIISISPNGGVWACSPADLRFDSIAVIPNTYSPVLSNARLYFYNNQAVWELNLKEKKAREVLKIPSYQQFEVSDGFIYFSSDQGLVKRYEVRDVSVADTVTESGRELIRTKNSLLIRELPNADNESQLFLIREKKTFSTRISTTRDLSVYAETPNGILLKEAITGSFYAWDLKREKITKFEASDYAHFFEEEAGSYLIRFFSNSYKSPDSLAISKISPEGKITRVNTSIGSYFWDEVMVAGVILKPRMSNIVVSAGRACFMSFGFLPGENTRLQLILNSVSLENGNLERWACSDEMTRDFQDSFTTFKEVYTLEIRNEELAIFPSNGGGKRFLLDTGKKTFRRSDLKANYHRDFVSVGNENYYKADWDSLTIFNRPANTLKRIPRQNHTYVSGIISKHVLEKYAVMPYLSESRTLAISLFDGTDTKAVEVYPGLPPLKDLVTRISGMISKKYALFYFLAETFDREYISGSFVLDFESATLKKLDDNLLAGIELASGHAVKYLYDSKILLMNEKLVDLNTLEVEDFKIEYNHYLRHFTDSGYFIFSKDDSLKRFNIQDGSTKLLAVKSYFNLSMPDGKFIFSEDNVLKALDNSGQVKELIRVEEKIMLNSVTRLSENLLILRSKRNQEYALVDKDKVSYFKPGNAIETAVYFNSMVYFTDSQGGLYRVNTGNMQIHFLGERKITEFMKSENGLYLYAGERLPGNKRRYIRIDKEALTDLFTTTSGFDPRVTLFDGEKNTELLFLDIEGGRHFTIKSNQPLKNGYVVLNMEGFLIFDSERTKYGFSKKDGRLSVLDISERLEPEFTRFKSLAWLVYKDAGIGTEIWQTDGTEAGTYLAYDINPGPNGSAPGQPFVLKNNLFVFATTPSTGLQLWQLTDNNPGEENEEEPGEILLPNENIPLNFSFYPNPTTGYLNISSTAGSPEKYTITVFSTDGKVLSEKESALPQKLDLSGLRSGIYLINVSTGRESSTFRAVKN